MQPTADSDMAAVMARYVADLYAHPVVAFIDQRSTRIPAHQAAGRLCAGAGHDGDAYDHKGVASVWCWVCGTRRAA